MTAPQTLAEFLLARVAEDEATARRVGVSEPIVWGLQAGLDHHEGVGSGWVEVDPGRVLAECEAKRRILEMVQGLPDENDDLAWRRADDIDVGRWLALSDVIKILAQPYAGHPDFREEWRL